MVLKQISSLEKVFLNRPVTCNEYCRGSMLLGEEFAYQIAFSSPERDYYSVCFESDLEAQIDLFEVQNVPSALTALPCDLDDDNYITFEPGLFPDVLNRIKDGTVVSYHQNKAIWVNIKTNEYTIPGEYSITVTFENSKKTVRACKTFTLEIIGKKLPEQTMIFTQWFHGDCIASYYKEEMFSESHWQHLENFIRTAAEHGVNMLLTPIFTPPLDTAVGGERPTIQLVDVFVENGGYTFGFEKLKRWIDLCKKCGIQYFEMSHLFTQWGATQTPKIMAMKNGRLEKIFGWETSATSEEYKGFMAAFLPELTAFLKAEGIGKHTYFHVSDEPFKEHVELYSAAVQVVAPYLKDFKIIDALSTYRFYQEGLVKHPIPDLNHAEEFADVPELWTYYCCAQGKKVSNRFFAMPSARNRIIGTQLYKYNVKGFLQWGYNFYYSCFSKGLINPYQVTDADGALPSGDSFSVYPGENGKAVPSLRLKVFLHALQDMRALKLLESILGREEVLKLVDAQMNITFTEYPKSAEFILNLREKVNFLIKEA